MYPGALPIFPEGLPMFPGGFPIFPGGLPMLPGGFPIFPAQCPTPAAGGAAFACPSAGKAVQHTAAITTNAKGAYVFIFIAYLTVLCPTLAG